MIERKNAFPCKWERCKDRHSATNTSWKQEDKNAKKKKSGVGDALWEIDNSGVKVSLESGWE